MSKIVHPLDQDVKNVLIEALRRWLMATEYRQEKLIPKRLAQINLGQGPTEDYAAAVIEGYMRHTILDEYALTDQGAKIVRGWLDKGIRWSHFHENKLPFDPDGEIPPAPPSWDEMRRQVLAQWPDAKIEVSEHRCKITVGSIAEGDWLSVDERNQHKAIEKVWRERLWKP